MKRKIDIANVFDALGTSLTQVLADRDRMKELEAENVRLQRLLDAAMKRLQAHRAASTINTHH